MADERETFRFQRLQVSIVCNQILANLAAQRPKCLCFRIKRTWYLRSSGEEKSQTFCGKQWEYAGRCHSSEAQKRFPVIAIKLQSFPTNLAAVFLRHLLIGRQISLSDWGWCISGEVLMLLAPAKNSCGATDPQL